MQLPLDSIIETMEGFKPVTEVYGSTKVPGFNGCKTVFSKIASSTNMSRDCRKCYRLRTRYAELTAPYDSLILAIKGEEMPEYVKTGGRKFANCEKLVSLLRETPLLELKPGDWVLVRKRADFEGILPEEMKYWDDDMFRLLGLFIADGYLNMKNRYRQVFWSQSVNGIHGRIREYYVNALRRLGYNVKLYERAYRFYIDNAMLARIFEKYASDGRDHARFTLHLANLPLEKLRMVIQGYFDGDGWVMIDRNGLVQIGFSDSPENLRMLKFALHRFGIRTSVVKTRRKVSKKYGISGTEHYILITGEDVIRYIEVIGSCVKPLPVSYIEEWKMKKRGKKGTRMLTWEYELQKISSIYEVGELPVYSVKTESARNIVVDMIVVSTSYMS